jgi:hypothetical protein
MASENPAPAATTEPEQVAQITAPAAIEPEADVSDCNCELWWNRELTVCGARSPIVILLLGTTSMFHAFPTSPATSLTIFLPVQVLQLH